MSSRIYYEKYYKNKFIEELRSNANITSELVFVKKYHRYEPYLNFLPNVISDIVMSYIDDIFNVKCIIEQYEYSTRIRCILSCHDDEIIFSVQKYYLAMVISEYLIFEKLNTYAKYYYGRSYYFSFASYDNMPYLTLEHKNLKHTIVILKLITKIIRRIIPKKLIK